MLCVITELSFAMRGFKNILTISNMLCIITELSFTMRGLKTYINHNKKYWIYINKILSFAMRGFKNTSQQQQTLDVPYINARVF